MSGWGGYQHGEFPPMDHKCPNCGGAMRCPGELERRVVELEARVDSLTCQLAETREALGVLYAD